jgi:ribosome-binding factor A
MRRRATQRTERVGQQVHEILASILLFDVGDQRLRDVQITSVDVATDLKTADVYYIVIDEQNPEPDDSLREAIEGSAGYLRKLLGERTSIKFVPELRFKYDESVERGRRIEALLDDVRGADEESE